MKNKNNIKIEENWREKWNNTNNNNNNKNMFKMNEWI